MSGRSVRVAVAGAGHVGLVTGVCLAIAGHRVRAFDVDEGRIERLRAGQTPFFERDLDRLLAEALRAGRITFHSDAAEAMADAEVAFVCVGTPNLPDGRVDLSALTAAGRAVIPALPDGAVLVNRSTAPVGTVTYLASMAEELGRPDLTVAVNPEFLAEGTAMADFLSPDRVVIGTSDQEAARPLIELYEPILARRFAPEASRSGDAEPAPLLVTDPPTAELIKYAANAFLAMKISFINEIAWIAEEFGSDVTKVSQGVGLDDRIGPRFLEAGIGWGGSCFPKDIVALQGMAETRGLSARLLRAANEINDDQRRWVRQKLEEQFKTLVGRRVALLGVTFKANTDDLRNAPALEIMSELAALNVRVRAVDPAVKELPGEVLERGGDVEMVADVRSAVEDADALVLLTGWSEFADLDFADLASIMRHPLILDGRNFLDGEAAREAGFVYIGVGRPSPTYVELSGNGNGNGNGHRSNGSVHQAPLNGNGHRAHANAYGGPR